MANMILAEMLEIGVFDSEIAGKIYPLQANKTLQIISEAQLDVASFTYDKGKNDPKPKVLVLGRWRHPNTNNQLVCGVNLHYLTQEQVTTLKQILPQIMVKDSLKAKYWEGMTLAPDIFKTAYRTYDERFVKNVTNSEFDVPDHVTEPEQQNIEPLNKPTSPEMPVRAPAEPPPPDIADEPSQSSPSAQIGDVNLGGLDGDISIDANTPAPGVDDRKPEQIEVPEKAPPKPQEEPEKEDGVSASLDTPVKEKPEKKPEGTIKRTLTKAKDVIKKLSSLISNKLGRNKAKKKEAGEASSKTNKGNLSSSEMAAHIEKGTHELGNSEEQEVTKLKEIEKEHEVTDSGIPSPNTPDISAIADKIDDVEDKVVPAKPTDVKVEDFESQLDAILERFDPGPRGRWATNAEYVELHAPSRFFTYHSRLGNTVLECTTGTQLFVAYHIPSRKLIMDLADSHFDVLEDAGWRLIDTICLSGNSNKLHIINESRNRTLRDKLLSSNVGRLLLAVSQDLPIS